MGLFYVVVKYLASLYGLGFHGLLAFSQIGSFSRIFMQLAQRPVESTSRNVYHFVVCVCLSPSWISRGMSKSSNLSIGMGKNQMVTVR